jgi:hypothetical protein
MRSEARALRSTDEGLELNVMRRPSIRARFPLRINRYRACPAENLYSRAGSAARG